MTTIFEDKTTAIEYAHKRFYIRRKMTSGATISVASSDDVTGKQLDAMIKALTDVRIEMLREDAARAAAILGRKE